MPESNEAKKGRPWKIYWFAVLLFILTGAFGFVALCVWDDLEDCRNRKFFLLGFLTVFCIELIISIVMIAVYFTVFVKLIKPLATAKPAFFWLTVVLSKYKLMVVEHKNHSRFPPKAFVAKAAIKFSRCGVSVSFLLSYAISMTLKLLLVRCQRYDRFVQSKVSA